MKFRGLGAGVVVVALAVAPIAAPAAHAWEQAVIDFDYVTQEEIDAAKAEAAGAQQAYDEALTNLSIARTDQHDAIEAARANFAAAVEECWPWREAAVEAAQAELDAAQAPVLAAEAEKNAAREALNAANERVAELEAKTLAPASGESWELENVR